MASLFWRDSVAVPCLVFEQHGWRSSRSYHTLRQRIFAWVDCAKRKGVNAEPAFVSSLNPGCPTAVWWLGDLKISFFCCVRCVGHDGFLHVKECDRFVRETPREQVPSWNCWGNVHPLTLTLSKIAWKKGNYWKFFPLTSALKHYWVELLHPFLLLSVLEWCPPGPNTCMQGFDSQPLVPATLCPYLHCYVCVYLLYQ